MKPIIAMIPARMASTRFPGKPLADICGKSMIEHVWRRVRLNSKIDSLYVATCDSEIQTAAQQFGAEVIMTSKSHERCTDRIAEACAILDQNGIEFDLVLNIQGDEPLLHPDSIDLLIQPFLNENNVSCVNLVEKLESKEDIIDPNNVKAVFDCKGNALYFSRLPIPHGKSGEYYKQLGVYCMSREMVMQYPKMRQTPLEVSESVDMLRLLENGISVNLVVTPYASIGVDTPGDYSRAIQLINQDEIFRLYCKD